MKKTDKNFIEGLLVYGPIIDRVMKYCLTQESFSRGMIKKLEKYKQDPDLKEMKSIFQGRLSTVKKIMSIIEMEPQIS